jgi:hypothetical protein
MSRLKRVFIKCLAKSRSKYFLFFLCFYSEVCFLINCPWRNHRRLKHTLPLMLHLQSGHKNSVKVENMQSKKKRPIIFRWTVLWEHLIRKHSWVPKDTASGLATPTTDESTHWQRRASEVYCTIRTDRRGD